MIYKAFSMWQPWASLVAKGLKGVETRSRKTSHRGVTLIHAAKHWTREENAALQDFRYEWPAVAACLSGEKPPLGAIVAVAYLQDCKLMTSEWCEQVRACSPMEHDMGAWEPGRYGLILGGAYELLRPIPYAGSQGFPFNVPDAALGDRAEEVARLAGMLLDRLAQKKEGA